LPDAGAPGALRLPPSTAHGQLAAMPITRRAVPAALAVLGPLAAAVPTAAAGPAEAVSPWLDADLASLQAAMQAGRLTARELMRLCQARIQAIDAAGPTLRAVLELDPDADSHAAALDDERRARGPRGPLHGIPVLLKDNIATGDRMQTTAGSLALVGHRAPRDAHLVARLREAGAVILGKTNLSEWANLRSSRATSGWSGRGGLTRNPYALDRNASGSSSGSAVAVAAGLCPVAVGTETDGSITSPASVCGIVGLKPTLGRVSRDGVVPISFTQDTAGPMGRHVTDVAALLAVLAGPDARDDATARMPSDRPPLDAARALDPTALRGARLGVARSHFGAHEGVIAVIEQALAVLKAQGAELVDPVDLPADDALAAPELEVMLYEIKPGLARYLAEFAPGAPFRNITDLVAWNRAHAAQEMPWFAQEYFEQAAAKGGLDEPAYLDALATCRRLARDEGLVAAFERHRLDAVIAPTSDPAWVTDLVNGDRSGASFTTLAAVAGFPHLTVPAGFVHDLPVNLSFVGPAWSEARLLDLGFAFERSLPARRAPRFLERIPGA
jgi:amidase